MRGASLAIYDKDVSRKSHATKMTSSLKYLAILALITAVLLIAADRLLGLFGYPDEITFRVAHPPNFHERRKNIEYQHDFRTNDQGLRYRPLALEKPASEARILLLGDSYVEGEGVELADTFGAQLERIFSTGGRDARFINGGLAGTAPLEYWRLFYNVGLKYDPDAVLICIYANDVTGMPERLSHEELYRKITYLRGSAFKEALHALFPRMYTILKAAQLARQERSWRSGDFIAGVSAAARERGVPDAERRAWRERLPPALVEAVNRGEYNGAILGQGLLRPYYWTDSLDIDTPRAKRKWESMVVALDEIVKVSESRGISVGMVYFPAPQQYDSRMHLPSDPWIVTGTKVERRWLTGEAILQQALKSWTDGKRIPFLDVTPVFRAAAGKGADLAFPLDSHWTPLGHRLAADAIADWLIRERVFPVLSRSNTPVASAAATR